MVLTTYNFSSENMKNNLKVLPTIIIISYRKILSQKNFKNVLNGLHLAFDEKVG